MKGQNRTGNATIVNDLRSPSTTTVQQVVGSSTTSPGYRHGSSHDSTHTNEHGAGACNRTPLTSSPSDSLEVPTAFGSTEAILTWPIFNGRWSSNVLSNEILIGNVPSAHAERESGKRASVGINEENVPFLVESFLQLVHSKNPVFHTQQIRVAARQVAECGFGWDASSCIVVCTFLYLVEIPVGQCYVYMNSYLLSINVAARVRIRSHCTTILPIARVRSLER